ncbi:MAG: P-II family nitrogen regulator [Myxococcota bacterium]
METFAKTKVEIVTEATVITKLEQLARSLGVRGYTILPVLAGEGTSGRIGEMELSSVMSSRLFMVVADEILARRFVEQARTFLFDYRAIIVLSEVEVLRGDQF